MADAKPISTPEGREGPLMPCVFVQGGEVLASSRDVAAFFEKQHAHVLRDIDHLIHQEPSLAQGQLSKFGELFIDVEVNNGATRKFRIFNMNRDGFSLLAMGFTGPRALKWKLAYIRAFNLMEAALLAQPDASGEDGGFSATDDERILNMPSGCVKDFLTQPEQAEAEGMMRWKLALETVREARRIWGENPARLLWRRLGLPICASAAPALEAAAAPARRQPLDLVRDVLWKLDDGHGVRRSDLNYNTTQIRGPAREAALEELERRGEIARKKIRDNRKRGPFAEWIFVVQGEVATP